MSLLLFLVFNNIAHSTNEHKIITYDSNVAIEILNIVTNGVVLPNNTLSFNGVNDLVLEFDVKTTYTGTNTNNYHGFLNCYYYEPNSFDNETAEYYNNGVIPLYLFNNAITLLPVGNTNSYTFHKIIHLKRNTVYNTGCSIVFRYRNDSVPTTILKKLTYNIIGGTKTGNEPYSPPTSNLTLSNISYSIGLPLINNEIVVPQPPSSRISLDEQYGMTSVNLSFNFTSTSGSNLVLGYYPHMKVQLFGTDAQGNYVVQEVSDWFDPTDNNGSFTFNNLNIKSAYVMPNSYLRIVLQFQGTTQLYNCGLVKLSKPIRLNTIATNQTLYPGQYANNFTSSQPIILSNGIDTNITSFQWQKKINIGPWNNIIGATNKDYIETSPFSIYTTYRRVALFNGLYNYSNEINISIINTSINNTICCNQHLLANGQPQSFTGSTPSIVGIFSYQWQIATSQSEPYNWTNISGATSQNHTYFFTYVATRDSEFTRFRRNIIQNSSVLSTSNIIIIRRQGAILRMSSQNESIKNNDLIENDYFINVYPNPSQNYITVKCSKQINLNKIDLFDLQNIKLNLIKNIIDENSFEIDISNLNKGIYILKNEENNIDIKKIIKD